MKVLVATLSLALLVMGCDKIQEKIAEKVAEKAIEGAAGGGTAKVDTKNGSVTVTDPKTGTTVQSGAAVKLPDGWPANVPVYPGASIRNAMTTGGGKTVMIVTKDPPAKVSDFYKTKIGLKVESDMDLGQQHLLVFKNGKGTITVSVSASEGDTVATLAVVD